MDDVPPGGGMILIGRLTYRFGRSMIIALDGGEWWKVCGLPLKARKLVGQRVVAHCVRVGLQSVDVVEIDPEPDEVAGD
jgi:hypothetical protein